MTEKVNKLTYSSDKLKISIYQDFYAVYGFKIGPNPKPAGWVPRKNPKEVKILFRQTFTPKEFKKYLVDCMNCGNPQKSKAATKLFDKYSWLFEKKPKKA
jgi:hypothetical protein